ncbi:unnamed protein product [Caenorhabditis bovis]|uniref:Domain of unknown function DB domain-containing protein n=1 Tax=Caenorhabditis bovis TaxID=2654633 RepID=A0A8S1EYS2_9PELO|nr:unnamed protein product [Caenorhabditis bovis]
MQPIVVVCLLVAISTVLSQYDMQKCEYTKCHSMLTKGKCRPHTYLVQWDYCDYSTFLTKKELCCEAKKVKKCRRTVCHSTFDSNFCAENEFVSEWERCGLFSKSELCCRLQYEQ